MEPVLVSVGNNFKIWDTESYSQLYAVSIFIYYVKDILKEINI